MEDNYSNLLEDELKVAECGTIDFTKFTDSSKGYLNIDASVNGVGYGITFTSQDVLDVGFTEEEAKTIINSLITKNVLTGHLSKDSLDSFLKTSDVDSTYLSNTLTKDKIIDGKWMFLLSEEFINYIANKK